MSAILFIITPLLLSFSGCAAIGSKSASIAVVYGIMMLLALFMLIGYICIVQKKEAWLTVLFICIAVVNSGYFSLAVSSTIEEALLANRISYLGSVFLPIFMLMVMLDLIKIKYEKWFSSILVSIGSVVFFIAASPGYLDIYYKEVTLITVNGVSSLDKVYGPLHVIYLFYLVSFFAAMIGVAVYAAKKKKLNSIGRMTVLISAFSVNIGVWFIEQIVKFDFELLSVSYIISELFLLGLHLVIQEEQSFAERLKHSDSEDEPKNKISKEQKEIFENFSYGFRELTPAERHIYGLYIEGKTTAEIREELNITENTLKYHNKNIYSKLGVSSKKELLEVAKMIDKL